MGAPAAADQIVLRGQVLKVADRDKYDLSEDLFSYEPYGLVISRGDTHFRLAVNRALAKTFGTNQILALYRKWFGEFEMEPNPLLLALVVALMVVLARPGGRQRVAWLGVAVALRAVARDGDGV